MDETKKAETDIGAWIEDHHGFVAVGMLVTAGFIGAFVGRKAQARSFDKKQLKFSDCVQAAIAEFGETGIKVRGRDYKWLVRNPD